MPGSTSNVGLPYGLLTDPADIEADGTKLLADALDTHLASLIGSVVATARSSAPTGWLLCDGAAVSRSTYANLFSAIGTAYGAGNGSTTFNVPDLRGRVPVGVDGSAGRLSANDALGNSAGEEKHTLTTGEMPTLGGSNKFLVSDGSAAAPGTGVNLVGSGTNWNFVTPSNTAHNTMQPYQVVNWMIRT